MKSTYSHPSIRSTGIAALAFLLLLTWNAGSYYLRFAPVWANCVVLLAVFGCSLMVNARFLSAKWCCWANFFLVMLALFHLGYYVPVRLGVVDPLPFMPPVDTRISEISMTLLAAAALSFEAGTLLGSMCAGNGEPSAVHRKSFKMDVGAVLNSGLTITILGAIAILVFVFQIGGIFSLMTLKYQDFYSVFLQQNDPRFAMSGMWFLPAGLLLTYVGMVLSNAGKKQILIWKASAIVVFFSQILLGARGPVFLLLLGYLYFRNHLTKKLRASAVICSVLAIAVLAPVIAMSRNAGSEEKMDVVSHAKLTPLAIAIEAGGTYRPFYGFTEIFEKGSTSLFWGKSYSSAVRNLIPNIGVSERREDKRVLLSQQRLDYRSHGSGAAP